MNSLFSLLRRSIRDVPKLTSLVRNSSNDPGFQPVTPKKSLPACCERARPECGICPRYKYMDIDCKVAVITEGATGVGFDIANDLLCNEAYRVILTGCDPDIGSKALQKLRGPFEKERVCFINMNVRRQSEFQSVLNQISNQYGGIDILVNNSKTINEKFWEAEIALNLSSVVKGTMLGLELMKKQKKNPGGVIINVSSILSFDSDPNLPVFTSTQHGVAAFTRSFGDKAIMGGTGVRVVGVCPGPLSLAHVPCSQGLDLVDKIKCATMKLSVGKSVVHMIQYAPTGSIWVVEGDSLYRLNIPDRKTYQKKITYV